MKLKILSTLLIVISCMAGCRKLDVPPVNIVQDKDIFASPNGVQAYMARIYSEMPIEDFRFSPTRGFNFFWIISPFSCITGEGISRDIGNNSETNNYWSAAYSLIRETDYFLQTLPKYSANFTDAQIKGWMGEARFVRAVAYFALVKRYGGVPVVNTVLDPTRSLDSLMVPRYSEQAVYDSIASDLDLAYKYLPETNQVGRANRYAAAGFKSRAMLFAGSIAKYNKTMLFDNNKNQLCGIPAAKANDYFKAAYDAAMLLDGKYSLYKNSWSATDRQAQYTNYVNLFFDAASPENILVKQYHYPESVHGFDSYNVPRQSMGANGYSAEINPTLEFVEMFDGIPKDANGRLQTIDPNTGKYILYNTTMDLYANAEPRLRATVILPGDVFKGENIEIRRGIDTADIGSGISPLLPPGSKLAYNASPADMNANPQLKRLLLSPSGNNQIVYTLPNGTKMNASGLSGPFNTSDNTCAMTGFSIRKYLNEKMPKSEVLENHSAQTWIELRYAEVLLNRAEAGYELASAGQGSQYLNDAYTCINQVRERAGAVKLNGAGELNNVNIVRRERRKELAFENQTWWDLRRWRISDLEQNQTIYRAAMPFYVAKANKYYVDTRLDERNKTFSFDVRWYYLQIPNGAIAKSPSLVQNPGY
ncbi:RagB/SusD family nutrient uptake outer membrane protein [Chitinophaga sp. 212800010-3]|uniref:RagB/SusD family nutrient uptake outer membrane protein n=1 Tax=unclassified Chitinophaga TaxID=2619133 RepID=UPI002DF36D91|nr:RagB/SusD family nutrient uptake outer membrane protein [Chitinophaga sp. 212800010-3]